MAATYTVAGIAGNNPGFGWKLKSGTTWRSAVSARATDIQIPGWHGSVPSQRDVIDATKILLVWHVTADASVAGQLMERVDMLRGIITRPQADLVITRQGADLVPVTQTALGRLRALDETRVIVPRALAEVRATVEIPGVFWRGPQVDFSHTATGSGWSSSITGLEGVSAPIGDALILVTGPATSLRIYNGDASTYTSSESVLLETVLPAGEQLRLDCSTWRAVRGNGIGWSGAGTDVSAVVKPSVDVGPALTFTPRPAAAPAVTVMNAGTSTVQIRAKGAYL